MKVLVTGGAGLIGSHLVDRLLADGHSVRILDSLDPQVHPGGEPPDYLASEAELQTGDVRDHDAVARALDGVDSVVHFAAAVGVGQSMYEIERYTSVNAIGCAVVLEEVARLRDRIGKLVVAWSMSIYGEGQYANPRTGETGIAPPLRPDEQLQRRDWEVRGADGGELVPEPTAETKVLKPSSIYAVGKRDHEEMVLSFGAAYGLPAAALRFFIGYGERQALSNPYTGVVAIFASRLLNGHAPLVFEDGLQSRDFVDVRDVARAVALALTGSGGDGEASNVGSGRPRSVREIADTIARGLGVELEPELVGQYRAGDIRHCLADPAKAERLLGFRAEIDFESGMADLLSWLEGQEATDSVETAHEALVSRGLAR